MLHSLFYLETALHVSGGTTTHHQERKQLSTIDKIDKINCVTLHLVGCMLEYSYDAWTHEG